MKTLGVGILGFGFMGKTHTYAHHTIPLYYSPLPIKCRLKAVCEVTPELAAAAMETGQFERCTTNPLGVKGSGEAGCIGAPPAVINALVDALAPYGIKHIDMPATPRAIWEAIQAARPRAAAE